MDEKELQALYNAMSSKFDIGDYNSFKSKMASTDDRKRFYDAVSSKGADLGDYQTYENRIGGVKKKEPSISNSSAVSTQSPLLSQNSSTNQVQPTVPQTENIATPTQPELPPVEEDPITLARQADEKGKKLKSTGVRNETGAQEFIPDEQSIAESKKLKEKGKEQGYDFEELYNDFADFPDEAFDQKGSTKAELLDLYKNNKIRYRQVLNETKNRIAVKKGAEQLAARDYENDPNKDFYANQEGSIRNNEYVGEDLHPKSFNDFLNSVYKKKTLIDDNVPSEQRTQAITRLKESYAPSINAHVPGLQEEYDQSPLKEKLDIDQYAGLKTWELFEPEKYKQAISILDHDITPKYSIEVPVSREDTERRVTTDSTLAKKMGGKLAESTINEQIGKETVLRSLYAQGVQNKQTDLYKEFNDISKRNSEAKNDDEKAQAASDYFGVVKKLDEIEQNDKEQEARFPLTSKLKYDMQAKEILNDRGISIPGFMYNKYAHGLGQTVDAVENLTTTLFGSDADKAELARKRIGEDETYNASVYLPESENRTNSAFILQPSDELKKSVNKILNGETYSSATPEQKKKIQDLVGSSQDEIKMITNPDAGKSKNFFSKATALSVAGFTSDIASFFSQMGILRGVGVAAKLAEATALFTPAYTEAFNQKIKEGKSESEANEYGLLHGGIMALMSKFGSKYEAVQNIVKGGKSPLSKAIAGISEETWNNIAKKNKSFIERLGGAAKSIGKEQAKMVGTFGIAAPVITDLADNAFYDKHKSARDMIENAAVGAKEMVIGSLGLIGFGLVSGSLKSKANPMEKSAIWEMGDNPELNKSQIEEHVVAGDISREEGELRKKAIDNISVLINKVPKEDNKGEVMDDRKRQDYLYNLVVENKATEQSKDLPDKQAEKFEMQAEIAKHKNGLLVEPKTPEQLEKRKAQLEKSLIPEKDAEGKNIEIPEKEVFAAKAEIAAIDEVLDEHSASVADSNAKRLLDKKEADTKLSEPIQGLDEQGVPIGDNVPPPITLDQKGAELTVQDTPTTTESKDAVTLLNEARDTGKLGVFKNMEDEAALKMISEQAQNIDATGGKGKPEDAERAMQSTVNQFGKELVDAAIEKYPAKEPVEASSEGGKTTSIKNAVTKEEREQRKLPEIEIVAKKTFGDVFDTGKKAVDEGTINPKALAKEVAERPRPLKPEESVALLYDRMRLHNEHKDVMSQIEKAVEEGDQYTEAVLRGNLGQIEEDININDIASRKTGYEQGLGLAVRKMMIKEDYSLANQLQRLKVANEGKEIPEEVRQKMEALTIQLEEAQSKLEEYDKKINELQAKKNIPKRKPNNKKSKEDFNKERKDIFKDIKDKWKDAGNDNTLSALPLPYAKQLAKITPDVARLIKSYAEQGFTELKDIVADIHANLKIDIPEITEQDVIGLLAGEFKEKKLTSPDKNKMELQAKVEKIKRQIDLEKEKIRLSNRTKGEKRIDWFLKWRRLALLSGVKVLGKIGIAAGMRSGVTSPIESGVGEVLRRIPGLKQIARGAPREGSGFNPRAEAKALAQWVDKMTYKDIKEIMTTGEGQLDHLHKDKLHPAPTWMDFFGQLHSAIKTLPKRAEYFRSFELRAEHAAKEGKDLTDPVVQQEIAAGAYSDALRTIFMNDNYVTDAYKSLIRSMEASKIEGAKSAAFALKFLFPIIKVPTNFVAESTTYMIGGLKAAYALRKGIKDLSPAQKDYILRAFKKQTIGAAFIAIGYFNPQAVGGYFTGKRKDDDIGSGTLSLFGVHLPHWMSHTPLLEALQLGATLRRTKDAANKKKAGSGSLFTGLPTALSGTIGQIPFFSQGKQIGSAVESMDGFKSYLFRTGQGVVEPQLIKEVAELTDTNLGEDEKYDPATFLDQLKLGIPGVRQQVPKEKKKGKY